MRILLLILLLLSLGSIRKDTVVQSDSKQKFNSLLWRISGNGLLKPSYLFGTMHMICPDDFKLSDSLKSVFKQSEQVVLELKMDDPNMGSSMMPLMLMKDGNTIEKLLSVDDFNTVSQYFEDSLGMISLNVFNGVKPMLLSSMMYVKMLGCEPQSYEMTFVGMAKNQKKEVLGLETFEKQAAIFDSIPYQFQADELVETVKNNIKAKAEMKTMVQLYKSQNIDELLAVSNAELTKSKAYETILLNARNQDWIDKIVRFSNQKSTFIAVGAAHLGGEKGVINLLKKRGYQVEAIRNE